MKLSDFKKQQGLSYEQLTTLIGDCSESAVIKWERGERVPQKDQMERIFRATNGAVTPNDFFDIAEASE